MSRNQLQKTVNTGFRTATHVGSRKYTKSNSGGTTYYYNTVSGDKLLYSEGHRGPPYRSGGPFAVVHCKETVSSGGMMTFCWAALRYDRSIIPKLRPDSVNGFMYDNWSTSKLGLVNAKSSVMNYESYGPGAIRRYRPDTPVFQFGQFVAELRDIPRLPWEIWEKANFFRNLGSQYLNAQFGWKPFLSDLSSLLNWQATMDKRLRQLIRDNRRVVRRRGSVDEQHSETEQSAGFTPSTAGSYAITGTVTQGNPSGVWTQRSEYRSNIWFSGAFQYFIEGLDGPGPDVERKLRVLKAKLSGFNLTPSLLYELTPWSWLLDWFTNVGDVISNAFDSVADRHVMRYGYLMRTEIWTSTATVAGTMPCNDFIRWNSGGTAEFENSRSERFLCTRTIELERKSRIAANPYSFGVLDWNGLSAFQTSILVALGLSSKFNR